MCCGGDPVIKGAVILDHYTAPPPATPVDPCSPPTRTQCRCWPANATPFEHWPPCPHILCPPWTLRLRHSTSHILIIFRLPKFVIPFLCVLIPRKIKESAHWHWYTTPMGYNHCSPTPRDNRNSYKYVSSSTHIRLIYDLRSQSLTRLPHDQVPNENSPLFPRFTKLVRSSITS